MFSSPGPSSDWQTSIHTHPIIKKGHRKCIIRDILRSSVRKQGLYSYNQHMKPSQCAQNYANLLEKYVCNYVSFPRKNSLSLYIYIRIYIFLLKEKLIFRSSKN